MNKLARSFAAIQAQYVDEILQIASQGVEDVIEEVDKLINGTITDLSWKEIVKSSLQEFRDIPNVLVHRLKTKIKGTTSDRNYTVAILLESLHKWAPLSDEPFDRSFNLAPPTQCATNWDSITSPITPTPAFPILSQPPETKVTPALESSTNDHTPDNHTPDDLQQTAKEWAKIEIKDSGFLVFVPSPDEWLDVLPTDNAVVSRHARGTERKMQETLEVEVNVDELLTMMEARFVESYIEAIMNRTTATSYGWLRKTAEVCQQRLEQLMGDRVNELNRRTEERKGDAGTKVIRVVRHMMAIANLTAAEAAIGELHEAIKVWDDLYEREEGTSTDVLVASINSPRASTPVHN